MSKEGRKSWLRYGLLAALLLAAALLWKLEGHENMQPPGPSPTPAPQQANQRIRREEAYERDAAALQALLESGAADEATQQMAAQKLAGLIEEHQSELGLEEALQQAGYENAVVIVQNGAVTVMIPEEKLTEETSAQILLLCVAHTSAGAENVRVMALR